LVATAAGTATALFVALGGGFAYADTVQDAYAVGRGNDLGGGVNNITQVGSLTTPPFAYSLDPTSSVIAAVTAGAGTGRI
jgi:pectate lyase